MQSVIKINKNDILSFCIAAYYALNIFNRVRQTLFQDSTVLQIIMQLGNLSVAIIMLLVFVWKPENIRILAVLEVLAGFLFLISWSIGELGETDWTTTYRQIAIYYIPLAVAAYNIINREKLLKYMYVVSLFAVPVLILVSMLSYGDWDQNYNMSIGYIMMFTALILLTDFTINTRYVDIILAATICVFVLLVGSRGPFLCLLSFILIEFFLSKRLSSERKIVIILVLSVLAIIIAINIESILSFIYQISQALGFNSRSLSLLMQGEFISHDAGRGEIWEYYWNLASQSPIFGHGIMGGWISDSLYPHNIILEFLVSFGYPLGFVAIALVFVIILQGIQSDDEYSRALVILLVSYCMLLLISNTFVRIWQFYVCLALCIPQTRRIKSRDIRQL